MHVPIQVVGITNNYITVEQPLLEEGMTVCHFGSGNSRKTAV
jgi:hypothetical protein